MLLVEGDPDCRSAGSFFKNPVVERGAGGADCGGERESAASVSGGAGGKSKLPAAWLIEQAGFAKGYALGAAGISSRHTLALVNRGGASATGSAGARRADRRLRWKRVSAFGWRWSRCWWGSEPGTAEARTNGLLCRRGGTGVRFCPYVVSIFVIFPLVCFWPERKEGPRRTELT